MPETMPGELALVASVARWWIVQGLLDRLLAWILEPTSHP
jgi:hypothetical protein